MTARRTTPNAQASALPGGSTDDAKVASLATTDGAGNANDAPWLLVDAGNSRIKWALAPATRPADWRAAAPAFLASGAVDHAEWRALAPQIRAGWAAMTAGAGQDAHFAPNTAPLAMGQGGQDSHDGGFICPAPAGVWLTNVAGEAAEQAVRMTLQTLWGMASADWLQVLRASETRSGVRNGYQQPAQLGSDRWASLIGAHAAWPGEHLLIVTLGTATTVEALRGDGEYLGGLIAPGPALMLQSLAQGTAQLPTLDAAMPSGGQDFARSTSDAILRGCAAAQAGLVERSHAQLQTRLGATVRCVLAGGARHALAQTLALPFTEHDQLVPAGLYEVALGTGGVLAGTAPASGASSAPESRDSGHARGDV
jgi:type III pantothenate kinase